MDLLRLRCEGQPSSENLEHLVTRLEQSDQLTQETLDDMLCRTPSGKRRPVVEERKTSRRTLRLLQSSLLTEWEVPQLHPIKKHYFGDSCCIYLVRDVHAHLEEIGPFPLSAVWPKISDIFHAMVNLSKADGRMWRFCIVLFWKNELCMLSLNGWLKVNMNLHKSIVLLQFAKGCNKFVSDLFS